MFKSFLGFNLVKEYHSTRADNRFHPSKETRSSLNQQSIASPSAMVLPISTPPNALAFSTNLVNQKDMTKIGLIVGIISMAVGYGVLYVLGKYHLI